MTNCVICHKTLKIINLDKKFYEPDGFICVCFDCIKKQNEKKFKIFN